MHKLPLKDVCKIQYGYPFDSKLFNANNIGKPLVRIRDVVRGYTETYTSETCADGYVVTRGDILIGMDGEFNIAKWRSDSAFLNQRVCKITPQGDIDEDYLLYYLLQALKAVEDKTSYVTVKHLSAKVLESIEIPLIGLQEQKEITTKLNRLSSLIDKRKQQLENLDKLIKSQFIEMFGGYSLRNKQPGWVKVGAVAEVVGGSTPKTDISEYWDGDFYWVTPAEIKEDDFIVTHTQRCLTEKGVGSCSLRRLPVGTVLLSSRAPIGKVAIAGVEMYCNQGFKNLICGEELNSVYVYALLKYNSDYLNSLGRGATFKEISKSIVENIYIPVPAIARQNEFARFVKQTDKSKFTIKQSLERLEILKKSLMQKYFG